MYYNLTWISMFLIEYENFKKKEGGGNNESK